ncbi:MAG: hypothetical protein EWV75_08130 [Microcystis wesenbergii Mw_QC_S_20081001_S30D]|uniref:Uncharacterized protein n=1 Tax=Microcystis wesenbergii Mw_QC_S_20081001_S30D TaxID=2486245 RepID=A0A552JQ39_9CHRO|nr:MAG: hypothetical protein EWV73_17495 [Microcystis wesenbergii Mw_QC_B_20070930_S4D]TRU97861.1 MAG: hypothetical protein EWV75_08130 [Microcystis wesenbergii Mw_QC_S_20081001_S30D]TRV04285.1 MAG: hypothetical protein EWV74_04950 [Microcystis wesenbergii Mw_QC_S_20081001_S30]TRV07419.1 MAG: hypothetical protein EWV89_22485 [Microcystis wesenbergii Mw_QC_B_20070930_S4]
MTTAFISKTIIVYRPQTTYFILTCRASDCQDFVNTEALTLSLSKCVEMSCFVSLSLSKCCFILVGVSSRQ